MKPSTLDESPYSRLRNPTILLAYTLFGVVTCILVAILARRVSPVALGVGLAIYLALAAIPTIYLAKRTSNSRTDWRNVMPCYLSVQDRDLRIIETNEMFRREFGDHIGSYCYETYKRRGSPCPGCPVLKTFEDGQIHSSDEIVITRDGQEAEVVVTSAPRRDRRGKIIGVVEMSTNITKIKDLQRELEESRDSYQRLFDLVPGYIAVMDRHYNVVESNKRSKNDFNFNRGQGCCYRIFKDRNSPCEGCIVDRSFADGEVHCSEETVITRDGRQVRLIVYSMPIPNKDGQVTKVMEVATDITEVKELEQQLILIGRAVAGMAHRIKNILMGLEGGIFVVNTAFETKDEEVAAQGWEMLERNISKVSQVAKDLLYCSKRRRPQLQEGVEPQQIAKDVHDLFAKRAASERIDITIENGDPHRATLDSDGIHTLITNLVTNAIDACRFDPDESKQRHRIVLKCGSNASGDTVISVEDNGSGIPEDMFEKVFEDFFSTKGTEGTGLGLLVIKRIVDEHDGRISFLSEQGKGTTFTVTIPICTEASLAAKNIEQADE